MSEVTRILSAIEHGDPCAAEQLLPLVYAELRRLAAQKLAQEEPGHSLQATALVHEAYLRLVDTEKAQVWNSLHPEGFGRAGVALVRAVSARNPRRGEGVGCQGRIGPGVDQVAGEAFWKAESTSQGEQAMNFLGSPCSGC